MRPIYDMPLETARNVRFVLCDIDDTITTDGRLTATAYRSMEKLSEAGIAVVPITGRPAGWCDMIARLWPVHGVVGENGAFYYAYDIRLRRMRRRHHPSLDSQILRSDRFDRIRERLVNEVPGAAISADQLFRIADLAVDYCEDVKPLAPHDVQRIADIFAEEGAVAKVSSIHVNGWFGDYDKLSMTRLFAADILDEDVSDSNPAFVFIGDSPNDSPMFEFFENSCAVANVLHFSDQLSATPRWVANSESGAGFCEIVGHLLSARR
ncbi:MAG: HAD-IIB family hydrolase [Rhodobacteraceae bacterium]|nr:HAD-IIB family hydrolase [Paracoccaceae bacterium]MCY4195668.1 HAD-IIB family hydrolase [Paracoccaceae bacterium]